MKTFVDRNGNVFAVYRSATESVHPDVYLLSSMTMGEPFKENSSTSGTSTSVR
jgi:hypothetical protein